MLISQCSNLHRWTSSNSLLYIKSARSIHNYFLSNSIDTIRYVIHTLWYTGVPIEQDDDFEGMSVLENRLKKMLELGEHLVL